MIKTYREHKEDRKGEAEKVSPVTYKKLVRKPEPIPTHEYVLAYPENVHNEPGYNGEYQIAIDDKVIKLQINNGVIKTPKDDIKESLIKNGFIFLRRKEISK